MDLEDSFQFMSIHFSLWGSLWLLLPLHVLQPLFVVDLVHRLFQEGLHLHDAKVLRDAQPLALLPRSRDLLRSLRLGLQVPISASE